MSPRSTGVRPGLRQVDRRAALRTSSAHDGDGGTPKQGGSQAKVEKVKTLTIREDFIYKSGS